MREKRVESLIRDLVSSLIMKGIIKDPRVNTLLTITQVDVSHDLAYARLYISSFEKDEKTERAVEALNHAAGFIQKNISRDLKMRVTPKLRFFADSSIREGFEINEKIDSLDISPEDE